MPRLLLVRHAEAVAHAPEGDLERPLTARGFADAARLGAYCQTAGLIPDLALVSPARRARETLDAVMREFARNPACEIETSLYNADVFELLDIVKRQSLCVNTLLIIGHNPSLPELARFLVDEPDGAGLVLRHFPAPCLALIQFTGGSWMDASAGAGQLERFINFSCMPEDHILSR